MNVRTLCLAILHHQDATGYEIRKLSTEGRYAYFVDASFGSIYPALAKLEDEGLVSCRQEQQDGKPPRKIYTINDRGRAALRTNLQESPSPDVYRSEFLLIGMCADLLESGDLARALDVHIEQVKEELSKIEEMCSEMVGTEAWLPDYGTACMNFQLTWLNENRARIIEHAEKVAGGKAHAEAGSMAGASVEPDEPPPQTLAAIAD